MRTPYSPLRIGILAALAAGLALLTACAPLGSLNLKFTPTSAAAAATGSIHITSDDRGNSIVQLQATNLPALTPPATVYMVWEQEADAIEPEGTLKDGKLKFKVQGRDFLLFITPEASSSVTEPTGPTLLKQLVSW